MAVRVISFWPFQPANLNKINFRKGVTSNMVDGSVGLVLTSCFDKPGRRQGFENPLKASLREFSCRGQFLTTYLSLSPEIFITSDCFRNVWISSNICLIGHLIYISSCFFFLCQVGGFMDKRNKSINLSTSINYRCTEVVAAVFNFPSTKIRRNVLMRMLPVVAALFICQHI